MQSKYGGAKVSKKDWIYSFYGGKEDVYGKVYGETLNEEGTEKEVEGVLKLLSPEPGSHILDWCGGWGRHSVLLAKKGFKITLLDFCQKYLKQAELEAKKVGVEINTICADFRQTPSSIQADYAINLFTAGLGYFSQKHDLKALKSVYRALKPGAKFLIDTFNLFWLVKNFRQRDWHYLPSDKTKKILEERDFDFWNNRQHELFIFQNKREGIKEESRAELRIYSPAELVDLLKKAGFKPTELYGDFDGSKFSFDSKRIVMISVRSKND